MMCDFCENNEKYEWSYAKCRIKRDTPYGTALTISDISYCPTYQECVNKNFPIILEMPINFCPICGRKLSKKTEKQTTDEIIAMIKENLTEDEQNKLDESIKSFADGVNGLWEVVRKEIENV